MRKRAAMDSELAVGQWSVNRSEATKRSSENDKTKDIDAGEHDANRVAISLPCYRQPRDLCRRLIAAGKRIRGRSNE
jgi:hypothetical protein